MALETSSRACQTGRPSLVGAMTLVHAMGQLRVSAEGERYGLDLHEHGITAYPEYVLSAMGQPGGMRGEGGL